MVTARRDNQGKVDLTLLPREALEQEARVWMYGGARYGRDNWRQLWGADTVRVCMASAMRHMLAINEGELVDEESELPHAAHIRCNMAMILEYMSDQEPECLELSEEQVEQAVAEARYDLGIKAWVHSQWFSVSNPEEYIGSTALTLPHDVSSNTARFQADLFNSGNLNWNSPAEGMEK